MYRRQPRPRPRPNEGLPHKASLVACNCQPSSACLLRANFRDAHHNIVHFSAHDKETCQKEGLMRLGRTKPGMSEAATFVRSSR